MENKPYYIKNLLSLAERYDLVVGDKFELFYRGIIKSLNPYIYYIHVECEKGNGYPRYYTFTPKESDVGDYKLRVTLYSDRHEVVDTAETTLHVVSPVAPKKKVNILCFGDSLTCNGEWPYIGYSRFSEIYPDYLNFIGKMKKEEVGFEGFGGWKWKEFCDDECVGISSSVWVKTKHNKDENDQHSTWECEGKKWILETIEDGRLKFKRGPGNWGCSKVLGEKFVNFEGGIHKEDIIIDSFEYEDVSPFFNKEINGPDFRDYCKKNKFDDNIDFVYVLLSWNGQYIPFNENFDMHDKYIRIILDAIKRDYPNAKVGIIGIQSPSINGGITASYGCHGYYSDTLGSLVTAYNYDEYLEKLVKEPQYSSFCRYIDMKAQFDVENNMPSTPVKVNARSEKTELLGTNGVHPTMAGYDQIGDCFYRALVSDLSDLNK